MTRNSNLELCRIASMVMIVLNHVVSLSGILDDGGFHANTLLSLFFLLGGKFGTNVFVIIGLYFLVDQKQFQTRRIARIWLQTLFYLIALNIVDVLVFSSRISARTWLKSFFPILGRSYWFVSSYIILLFLLPLLNKIYERLKIGRRHILAGTMLFSILPTLTFNGSLFGDSTVIRLIFKLLMFGPVWFSFLYFLVRYLKTHPSIIGGGSVRRYITIFLCAYGFMYLVEVLLYREGLQGNAFMRMNYSTIRDMSSFPCLIAAGAFFMIFLKLKIRNRRRINRIASNTFGIYLLHNHETTIPILWRGIFKLDMLSRSVWYLPYSMLLVAVIFGVSMLIEFIRKRAEHVILDNPCICDLCEQMDSVLNAKFRWKLNSSDKRGASL